MDTPRPHRKGIAAAFAAVALPAIAWATAAGPAGAATSEPVTANTATARLIVAEDGVAPGATRLSAAVEVVMQDGWKTYWRSPGAVGYAPEIDLSGSGNIAGADLLYPAPTRFRAFGIENVGYEGTVVFPVEIRLDRPGAAASIRAELSILSCAEVCVPETFPLALDLPAGAGLDPAAAATIAAAAARVPLPEAGLRLDAAALDADAAVLTVALRADRPFTAPDLFPELGDGSAFGPPDIRLGEDGRLLWARFDVTSDPAPQPLRLTVVDGGRAATLDAPAPTGPAPEPPFERTGPARSLGQLGWTLVLAFLGGMVLNVMPCVLPVLAIKLHGAIAARDHALARVRRGFLAAAAGVMVFLWTLAAGAVALKAAGVSVGWGIQFQNPVFLAFMAAVVAFFAANLAGLFQIALPQALATRLATAGGTGYLGDFATGAFAAVLATPCTAPLLGTALAFALSGGGVEIAAVFTAMGLGLALPYLAVAAWPGAIRLLPRPGPWMEWAKTGMAAALALTALWLLSVLAGVSGRTAALAVAGLVAAALLAMALRRLPLRGAAAAALVLAALAVPLFLAAPPAPAPGSDRIAWVAFERAAVAREVAAGRVVFVDVTADWCLTCRANKTLVLDRATVADALAAPGVVPMLADWTRQDAAITRYLQDNGRYGIPFNMVYGPAAPEGIALPELLTTDAVLEALSAARG